MSGRGRLLTSREVAELLGVSEKYLRAMRYRPDLSGPPFIKMGRAVRYAPGDVNAWLREGRRRGRGE